MTKSVMLAAAVLMGSLPAAAAEKVELKHVHMCCEGCAKEVADVLGKVEGVTGVTTDEETTTVRFTATDGKAAQKALDALAKAGFHGAPGEGKGYAFRDDSGAKPGKVKSLTVTGFHNSCGGCVKSFREAIQNISGVRQVTAKAKVSSAVVLGDFDAVELVKALNRAGFHVVVKP